nr:hypothetical protein [Bacteroidota bacterium]
QSLGSSSGSIDRALLSQLATRYNIKAVLLIDFTTYIPNEGKKISDNKTGFERLVVKATTSGENSFYDKKIKYTEYSQKKEVSVTISYKLIDTSNGEVLLSDRLSKHEQDEINYAEYDGSTENIYPSTNNNGVYSINEANYKHLQNLFKASRDIKSTGQLTDDIFKSITESVARKINNFDPEK